MTEKKRNDYFYVCSLIEYIARQTKNRRGVITEILGKRGIEKQLYDAEVNHCLSFEQVSDEVIEQYNIPKGDFDTITECKYAVPEFLDIGKLYCIMIEDCAEPGKEVDELLKIFSSFISDKISDFQTGIYYQNPNYLECSYEAGYLLDQNLICWLLQECVLFGKSDKGRLGHQRVDTTLLYAMVKQSNMEIAHRKYIEQEGKCKNA